MLRPIYLLNVLVSLADSIADIELYDDGLFFTDVEEEIPVDAIKSA